MVERLREGKVKKKEQSVIYTTAMAITVFCFFCFILFIILISFNFNSIQKNIFSLLRISSLIYQNGLFSSYNMLLSEDIKCLFAYVMSIHHL